MSGSIICKCLHEREKDAVGNGYHKLFLQYDTHKLFYQKMKLALLFAIILGYDKNVRIKS